MSLGNPPIFNTTPPAAPAPKVPGYIWLFLVLLAAGQGWLIYRAETGANPVHPSLVDGRTVGKSLVKGLPAVEAAGLRAMQTAMLAGKPMADVMAAGKQARHEADARLRAAAFAPALSRIVPEGTEPRDSTARADWAQAVGQMADVAEGR